MRKGRGGRAGGTGEVEEAEVEEVGAEEEEEEDEEVGMESFMGVRGGRRGGMMADMEGERLLGGTTSSGRVSCSAWRADERAEKESEEYTGWCRFREARAGGQERERKLAAARVFGESGAPRTRGPPPRPPRSSFSSASASSSLLPRHARSLTPESLAAFTRHTGLLLRLRTRSAPASLHS